MLRAINNAKLQIEVAQSKFDWAEGEDVEVATLQLLAAETSYNRMIQIAKKEGVRA